MPVNQYDRSFGYHIVHVHRCAFKNPAFRCEGCLHGSAGKQAHGRHVGSCAAYKAGVRLPVVYTHNQVIALPALTKEEKNSR